MKRKLKMIFEVVLVIFCVCGCGSQGKLDEGNISCKVALEEIPVVFEHLEESILNDIDLSVTLRGKQTDKLYHFHLTAENNFSQEATLKPGNYEVFILSKEPYYLDYDIEANQEVLEVGPNKPNYLGVSIADLSTLARSVQNTKPTAQIVAEDKFSRKMQWNGQVIDITKIREYVSFQYDGLVPAYEDVSMGNKEEGISISVVNETSEPANWKDCALKTVKISGSNIIFSRGVFVGMELEDVVHAKNGKYGRPDYMSGSILFGTGHESVCAYYENAENGDKITVMSDPDGNIVGWLFYEFADFQ